MRSISTDLWGGKKKKKLKQSQMQHIRHNLRRIEVMLYLLVLTFWTQSYFNVKHLQSSNERRQSTTQSLMDGIFQRVVVSISDTVEFGDNHMGVAILWDTILSARCAAYHCKWASG